MGASGRLCGMEGTPNCVDLDGKGAVAEPFSVVLRADKVLNPDNILRNLPYQIGGCASERC